MIRFTSAEVPVAKILERLVDVDHRLGDRQERPVARRVAHEIVDA